MPTAGAFLKIRNYAVSFYGIMVLNKVQSPEDMEEFLGSRKDKIAEIIQNAPEHIIDIIAATIHSLCIKMNMSTEHAAQCVGAVKERNMGYLFENMERLDIQLERKYDKKYREEYAKKYEEEYAKKYQEKIENIQKVLERNAQKEIEDALKKVEEIRREALEARQEAEQKAEQKVRTEEEKAIKNIVSVYKSLEADKELAIQKLREEYLLSFEEAEEKISLYWK